VLHPEGSEIEAPGSARRGAAVLHPESDGGDYYLPDGTRVALVHQYLRPDGFVGASGRPDPNALLKDGVLYFCS
jgi:hypothetical protein